MFYSNFVPKIFDLTLKPGLGVTQGHRNRHGFWYAAYDFQLMFYSNHGPISYRFLDKRRFQSKIAKNFPTQFCAPRWRRSPWNWVPALGVKKLERWGYRAEKEVDVIFSLVDTVGLHVPSYQHDRRMDIQTDGHRTTARPRLRIASRGNIMFWSYSRNVLRWHP